MGQCQRRYAGLCRVLLAFGRVDVEEWGLDGNSEQTGENCQTPTWTLEISGRGKMKNMEVVEDFESGPHEAVTLLLKRDKETQEVRELSAPTALPGYSCRTLPGRIKAEGGQEGER